MAKSGEELLAKYLERESGYDPSVEKYAIISVANKVPLLEIKNLENDDSRRIACVLIREISTLTPEDTIWTNMSLQSSYEYSMEGYDLVPGSKVNLMLALIARLRKLHPEISEIDDVSDLAVEATKLATET
jgi:hypothetical protein